MRYFFRTGMVVTACLLPASVPRMQAQKGAGSGGGLMGQDKGGRGVFGGGQMGQMQIARGAVASVTGGKLTLTTQAGDTYVVVVDSSALQKPAAPR